VGLFTSGSGTGGNLSAGLDLYIPVACSDIGISLGYDVSIMFHMVVRLCSVCYISER
jgi:hypothetical protein